MKNVICSTLLVIAAVIVLIGCGTKVGNGAVDVKFTNNTTSTTRAEFKSLGVLEFLDEMELDSTTLQGITPTTYAIKLVAFYMTEDIDPVTQNNVGGAIRIWTSSKCDDDLTYCGIDPAHSGQYVVDYFDFARGTDVVNADFRNYTRHSINDQVSPGTYRYIRMDFSGKQYDGDTMPYLKFGTSTKYEIRPNTTNVLVKLDTPFVLKSGQSFEVNLAYDLEKRFYESSQVYPAPTEVGSNSWSCYGTGSNIPCIAEATFSPTVTTK